MVRRRLTAELWGGGITDGVAGLQDAATDKVGGRARVRDGRCDGDDQEEGVEDGDELGLEGHG